jgi:hypothetical protein
MIAKQESKKQQERVHTLYGSVLLTLSDVEQRRVQTRLQTLTHQKKADFEQFKQNEKKQFEQKQREYEEYDVNSENRFFLYLHHKYNWANVTETSTLKDALHQLRTCQSSFPRHVSSDIVDIIIGFEYLKDLMCTLNQRYLAAVRENTNFPFDPVEDMLSSSLTKVRDHLFFKKAMDKGLLLAIEERPNREIVMKKALNVLGFAGGIQLPSKEEGDRLLLAKHIPQPLINKYIDVHCKAIVCLDELKRTKEFIVLSVQCKMNQTRIMSEVNRYLNSITVHQSDDEAEQQDFFLHQCLAHHIKTHSDALSNLMQTNEKWLEEKDEFSDSTFSFISDMNSITPLTNQMLVSFENEEPLQDNRANVRTFFVSLHTFDEIKESIARTAEFTDTLHALECEQYINVYDQSITFVKSFLKSKKITDYFFG